MLLVIDKTKSHADAASDIFNFMGIVSCGASPECATGEFSNRHHAVLFIHPERISSVKEIVKLARAYSLDSSVFAISANRDYDYNDAPELYSIFDKVFADGSLSSNIVYEILTYQSEALKNPIGSYRLAGIDASVHNAAPTYFDTPIGLTKTETMILRFLIASYPLPKSAKEILKYAFRSGKTPELPSIRTHISAINRKFMNIAGRYVISNELSRGYIISL